MRFVGDVHCPLFSSSLSPEKLNWNCEHALLGLEMSRRTVDTSRSLTTGSLLIGRLSKLGSVYCQRAVCELSLHSLQGL